MDRNTTQRIEQSPAGAVVITGPARSGKTSVALDLYDAHEPDAILIAPNATSAKAMRERLVSRRDSGVMVSSRVITFDSLAMQILSASGRSVQMLSALQRRLLLQEIVTELHNVGSLETLDCVVDTPGLTESLDSAIRELKRSAVHPEELAQAVGDDRKSKDLCAVYLAYQHRLLAEGACDLEGAAWLALEELQLRNIPDAFNENALLIADGFTDFTPTQLLTLRLLALHCKKAIITLPWADDGRERMWSWTRRSLESLQETFDDNIERIELSRLREDDSGNSLTTLCDGVFDFNAPQVELPEDLSAIASCNIESEIAAAARRIKQLLVDGARQGEIAILARSIDAYRPHIERVFREHNIPVAPGKTTLADQPVVRFVLDVRNLAPEFAFRDVLRVIKSSYFSPSVLGDFDDRTVATAEMIIRNENVLDGAEAYQNAVQRLVLRSEKQQADQQRTGEPETRLGPVQVNPEAIRSAGQMLASLFEIARDESLWSIVEKLELAKTICRGDLPSRIARDLRALKTFRDTLEQIQESSVPLETAIDALDAVTCRAQRGESLVQVIDVLEARPLRFKHVFLLGLSEGQFPRKFTDGSLIGETQRQRWRESDVILDSRTDLSRREMLLFYLAISRAEKTLTLGFQDSDAGGSGGAPGAYVLGLLERFGGVQNFPESRMERIRAGEAVSPPLSCATSRDAVNAAVASLFRNRFGVRVGERNWIAAHEARKLNSISRGLTAQADRWRRETYGRFDGVLSSPHTQKRIGKLFGENRVYSANQLSMYAECPWRFFARYVLHLEELVEPQRRIEALHLGLFCHDTLCRTYRELSKSRSPVRIEDFDFGHVRRVLHEAAMETSEEIEQRYVHYPTLWRVQRDRLIQQIENYLAREATREELDVESLQFERAFGSASGREDLADPQSTEQPVCIDAGDERILLRGRIDRIDRVAFSDVKGMLAVDYKTGKLPSNDDLEQGRNLQAALYAAAMQKLFDEPVLGGVFHSLKDDGKEAYFAEVTKSRKKYKIDPEYEEKLASVLNITGLYVQSIRSGSFEPNPEGRKCPSYCPYRTICSHSPARQQRKQSRTKEGASDE